MRKAFRIFDQGCPRFPVMLRSPTGSDEFQELASPRLRCREQLERQHEKTMNDRRSCQGQRVRGPGGPKQPNWSFYYSGMYTRVGTPTEMARLTPSIHLVSVRWFNLFQKRVGTKLGIGPEF